jgi:hypothetical protein
MIVLSLKVAVTGKAMGHDIVMKKFVKISAGRAEI